MILIISKNEEITTNEVIKWLLAMDKKFIRIHEDEVFDIKVADKRIYLASYRNRFFLDEIHSVWYRRGGLKFNHLQYNNPSIHTHMNEYQHWLEDYVIHSLETKRHVNKQSTSNVNKLLVLEKAKKVGLAVPAYFLADCTDQVALHQTITKPITGNISINEDGCSTSLMYTTVVEEKESSDFFISFFQEKIEKDFEIRSFYLDGTFYSTAILSQNDAQTKTDFRKYNLAKPNRNVRYQLPKDIEAKTHELMQILDVNCGSVDFIKSGDQYYFLEVNTVGQFLGISSICNYGAEKAIAAYL